MDKKLSSVADYLESRRKSSDYESHRLREVEAQVFNNNTILLNAGSNYMNLKTCGVIAKQQKFSDVVFNDDEDFDLPQGHVPLGLDGDPEYLDIDSNSEFEDTFGDEENLFDVESPIEDDEESFLDLSANGEVGPLDFEEGSTLAREEEPLEFEGGSSLDLSSEEDDRFPFGRRVQTLSSEDPLRNYIGHNKFSELQRTWLKEAKAEGIFKII